MHLLYFFRTFTEHCCLCNTAAMLKRLLPWVAALVAAVPETASRAASLGTSSASSTFAGAQDGASLQKFYKSLGLKPPQPRRMSPEAARMHRE